MVINYLFDWRILVGLILTLLGISFVYKIKDKIKIPRFKFRESVSVPTGNKTYITNWKKFLRSMYVYSPYLQSAGVNAATENENYRIAKKLREKGDSLSLTLAFLLDQKMIGRNITSKNPYANNLFLTQRGFDVMENVKRDRRIVLASLAIVYLAIVVLIAFIFNFIKDLGKISDDILFYSFLVVISIIGIFSVIILKDLIGES